MHDWIDDDAGGGGGGAAADGDDAFPLYPLPCRTLACCQS